MFAKSKLDSHMNTCKVLNTGQGSDRTKFSNYSPIKEADEEGKYHGEESKESSSLSKKKKPIKTEEVSDSSYTSDTESKSLSYRPSKKKTPKRNLDEAG